MKNKNLKISFILNIVIVAFTVFALVVMLTDYKFMLGNETRIASSPIGRFRFFTIDSNVLMGLVSLAFTIEEWKLLNGKIDSIDKRLYVFKLASTTSVMITFLVVVFYLAWITPYGFWSMFMNSNLFYHGLIPILSAFVFLLFDNANSLNFNDNFYSLIPLGIYALYYLSNVLSHSEGGRALVEYDWYRLLQGGIWTIIIMVPLMFGLTFIISFLFYRFNRKISN